MAFSNTQTYGIERAIPLLCAQMFTSENLIMSFIRILALTLVTGCLLSLAGCNTVEGLGKDIQKAGEKLEDAAD